MIGVQDFGFRIYEFMGFAVYFWGLASMALRLMGLKAGFRNSGWFGF